MMRTMSRVKAIFVLAVLALLCIGMAFGESTYVVKAATLRDTYTSTQIISWGATWGTESYTSSYTNDGAKITIPGNTNGDAWKNRARINWEGALNSIFNYNGDATTFKFKTNIRDISANSNSNNAFNIIFYAAGANNNHDEDVELCRIKVYLNAGGSGVPVTVHPNDTDGNILTREVWLSGEPSLSSEFAFRFSWDGFIETYIAGQTGWQKLISWDNEGSERTLWENAHTSMSGKESIFIDIQGDNGFNKNVDIIVTEINGESLAISGGGSGGSGGEGGSGGGGVTPVTSSNFVSQINGSGATVSMQKEAVLVQNVSSGSVFSIGKEIRFDVREGRTLTISLPKKTSSGADNGIVKDNCAIEFYVYKPAQYNWEDANNRYSSLGADGKSIVDNWIKIKIWGASVIGADRPSEIHYKKAGESNPVQISNCDWITFDTTKMADAYSISVAFDDSNLVQGHVQGVMKSLASTNDTTAVENGVKDMLSVWNTNTLAMAVGFDNVNNTEFYVSEVDGFSTEATDDLQWFNDVDDAKIVANIQDNTVIVQNSATTLDVCGYDLFGGNVMSVFVTKPDGTTDTKPNADFFSFTQAGYTALGTYKLVFTITGYNQNPVVSDEYKIHIKNKYAYIDVQLASNYASSTPEHNSSITILDFAYNANINTKDIQMKDPSGALTPVTVGSSYKFARCGLYSLIYTARDNAQPTPNEFVKSVTFSVIDYVEPVVATKDITGAKTGSELVFDDFLEITDDCECVISGVLTLPDGTKVKLIQQGGKLSYTPSVEGDYSVVLTVTDTYDNSTTTETLNFTVEFGTAVEDNTTNKPSSSKPTKPSTGTNNGSNDVGDGGLDSGFIIYLAICFGIVAFFTAYRIIKRKPKGGE